MLSADSSRKPGNRLVGRVATVGRVDDLGRELQVLMASRGVNVVVLQEHCRRQDDIGEARGVGHELRVNAHE